MSQTCSIWVEHHMHNMKPGKNIPTTENIIKLAQIYRVPTDYLLQVDYGEAIKFSMKQGKEWGEELADEYIEKMEKKRVRKRRQNKNKTSASAPYGLPRRRATHGSWLRPI